MGIKRLYCTFVMFTIAITNSLAQRDMIIMRSGVDIQGQVILVTKDKTNFKDSDGKEKELDNSDIYMIKYDKRGNMFFTEDGERITDNEGNEKVPKGASSVYLTEGKEIIAYDISIDVDSITFYPAVRKGGPKLLFISSNKKGTAVTYPKEQVFLIHHQDGTKDLITDFETLRKMKAEELARRNASDEAARFAAWKKSFPKAATIITKKEVVINAIVLADEETGITYKKASLGNSPIFVMDRENIQDIFYKEKM